MDFRRGSGNVDRLCDARTGLWDLDAFRESAERALDHARRSGEPAALALFDIDGFRAINGAYGSDAADAVLAELAAVLRGVTREGDLLARSGADELCVLLRAPLDGALACAQRVVDIFAESPIPGVGTVTVSAGAAEHARGSTIEQMLAEAGDGIDAARRSGGGRLAVGCDEDAVLASAQADVVGALATTLLERDRYTGEHSEWVVDCARAVARALGLDGRQIRRVEQAALLHDIGKVAIPDHILNKPGPLSDDEWLLMREHPVIGERILRAIPGMSPVAQIVRHEHESFDGSGYPDGLSGRDIPLGSRIILVCDSYHAITTDRPYRPGRSHDEAIAELARCSGTQFDPQVTEALIAYLERTRASDRVA